MSLSDRLSARARDYEHKAAHHAEIAPVANSEHQARQAAFGFSLVALVLREIAAALELEREAAA